MFAPLLSAINKAGGGVKFAQGGIAGMYAGGGYPIPHSQTMADIPPEHKKTS